jgi:hypothetical protein
MQTCVINIRSSIRYYGFVSCQKKTCGNSQLVSNIQ